METDLKLFKKPQAMLYKYDQLNRITKSRSLEFSNGNYAARTGDKKYDENYSYDANGNILTLQRRDNTATLADDFNYSYYSNTNCLLRHKTTGGTYVYDAIGNLITDNNEGLAITWTPSGKVRSVTKPDTTVYFRYDATGNRIAKIVSTAAKNDTTTYVRDASGNVMSIYRNKVVSEVPIYGSSRIGEYMGKEKEGYQTFNLRKYELSNHLGNVLAVITDKVNLYSHGLVVNNNLVLDSARATVVSASDYYPGGLPMKGRTFEASSYRYGFNTQEKVDEISGKGNHTTALYWEYDTRLVRRWNLDPKPNAWESRYLVMGGNPIWNTDILGDKWKTKADETKAKDLNSSLDSRKNSLNKHADKFTKKADLLSARGKEERANKLRAKGDEARSGATELGKAQTELTEIGASTTEFTFQERIGSNISYTSMDASGTVVIEFASDANAIHELTHAYQHLSGQIQLVPGTGGGYYHDATDEQQAYRRQYFFSPFSVDRLNSNSPLKIKTSKDIKVDFILKMWTTDEKGEKVFPYKSVPPLPRNKPGSPADK